MKRERKREEQNRPIALSKEKKIAKMGSRRRRKRRNNSEEDGM